MEAETLSVLIELFIEKVTEWSQMIHAISCIDVLRSFAIAAISSCGAMCRPIVLPPSKIKNSYMETMCPILSMRGLWHPYALSETGGMPVPNDVLLGGDRSSQHPGALLLTGPNMGGKSTLLRATCLAVILAQVYSIYSTDKSFCVLNRISVDCDIGFGNVARLLRALCIMHCIGC